MWVATATLQLSTTKLVNFRWYNIKKLEITNKSKTNNTKYKTQIQHNKGWTNKGFSQDFGHFFFFFCMSAIKGFLFTTNNWCSYLIIAKFVFLLRTKKQNLLCLIDKIYQEYIYDVKHLKPKTFISKTMELVCDFKL